MIGKLYDDLDRQYKALAEVGDIGLEPAELFLTADELRRRLGDEGRIEFRALGKGAAATDEDFQVSVDAPAGDAKKVRVGSRMVPESKPLFLFPAAATVSDIEITSRSTRKFHGDIAAFAAAALRKNVGGTRRCW